MTRTEIHVGFPAVCIDQVVAPDPHSPAVLIARGGGAQCRPDRSRAGSPAPRIPARIIAGRKVPEVFYELVHGRVTDVLPILERGIAYDCEVLCGSAFMVRLPPGRRLRVDACLADMAARGALPLEPVLDGADAPPRYRLKDTASDCVSPSAAIALLNTSTNFEG